MKIMTIEEMLQNEIAVWTEKNRPAVVKAIQDWYNYSGQVITIWQRGNTFNIDLNWVYSFSEACNNEIPGTAVGEIAHCFHGKVKKANLDGLRYIMGLED
jgi:hypothetical protein